MGEELIGVADEDIVIVGGGICGLATALALHRKGIRSVVLERSASLRATGGAITIKANGWIALDYLGLGSLLRNNSLAIKGFAIIDLDKGTQSIQLTREEDGDIRSVKRGDLVEALARELPWGTIRYGQHVCHVVLDNLNGGVILELSGGTLMKVKVLIGCDGMNSVVAKYLRMKPPTYSSTCVMRGLSRYPEGHGYEDVFTLVRKGRVTLGRVPLDDKVVYWEIMQKWTPQFSKISRSQELIKIASLTTIESFPEEMSDMINNCCQGSLSCTGFGYHAPWDVLLGRFRGEATTVAGDALHASGPFLGQGGAIGLEDAIVIARCISLNLSKANTSTAAPYSVMPYKEALGRYVSERRMRLAWLLVEANLMINVRTTSSRILRVVCMFLKALLFRDPTANTRFNCGPF